MNSNPQIISCVWGAKDYTTFLREYVALAIVANPKLTSLSFFPDVDFFPGGDPNPGLNKVCVVVWRTLLSGSTPSVPLWSQFKTSTGLESWPPKSNNGTAVTIRWDGVGDTKWIPPPPPGHRGQTVLLAYWFDADKTAPAVIEMNKYGDSIIPSNPTFLVNSTTMQGDPSPGHPDKQFCVIYANWEWEIQDWTFHTAVGMGGSSWNLVIPPNTLDVNSRVTLVNKGSGASIYPIVVDQDLNTIFDGSKDYQLPDGTVKDLDLVTQAGCAERQLVWINYKHPQSLLTVQPRLPFIASSSATAVPCHYSVSYNSARGAPTITKDTFTSSAPSYTLKDLRLNVYCATWGGKNYTEFVRQQYISSTIYNPPTETRNGWSFLVGLRSFGNDPNPGPQKCLVVIYRIARVVGKTKGVIFAPDQMDSTSSNYNAEKLRTVDTVKYPVLKDISDFKVATALEFAGTGNTQTQGGIMIDLLTQFAGLTPWTPPVARGVSIVKAVWANRDVTATAQASFAASSGKSITVSTDVLTKGQNPADPWYGQNKQCTVLASYQVLNPVDKMDPRCQYRTFVDLRPDNSWTLNIDPTLQKFSLYPQLPQGFTPDLGPYITTVQFFNKTTLPIWPRVNEDQSFWTWDGYRVSAGLWQISSNVPRTIDLVNQIGCTPDRSYLVTFGFGAAPNPQPYPPSPGWIRVGAPGSMGPAFSMKLTFTGSSIAGQYRILKELVYVGPE